MSLENILIAIEDYFFYPCDLECDGVLPPDIGGGQDQAAVVGQDVRQTGSGRFNYFNWLF